MKKIIFYQPFPSRKYHFIERLQEQNRCAIIKYRNIQDQSDYLFHEYAFRSLPKKIKRRIQQQIQEYSQYSKQNITIADEAYIFQSKEGVNISLKTIRNQGENTLEQSIKAKQLSIAPQKILKYMIQICQSLNKMHQSKHAHGSVRLSNIYYSRQNQKMSIGAPKYRQIQKWINAQAYSFYTNYSDDQQDFSQSIDIQSMGFVFLQMILGQIIQFSKNSQSLCTVYLPKVTNLNFRKILQLILRKKERKIKTQNIMFLLQKIQNHKQLGCQIQYDQEYAGFMSAAFNLNNQSYSHLKYSHLKNIKIKTLVKLVEQYRIEFFFIEDGLQCSIKCKQMVVLIDLKQSLQRYIISHSWLNNQIIFNFLGNKQTKIRVKDNGFIKILFNQSDLRQTKQRKRQKLISVDPFENICRIKSSIQRRGLILTERMIITPTSNIQQLKENQNQLCFECQGFKENNLQDYQCLFAQEELQMNKNFNSIYLKYCLIDLPPKKYLPCVSSYLKLIKDYQQSIIQEKIKQSKQSMVEFNYQLGSTLLLKGEVIFQKDIFTLPKRGNYISGEPLRLNISFNSRKSTAIIGLYCQNGKGFLFNDQFYRSLFAVIAKIRNQTLSGFPTFPFVFISCRGYNLDEEQYLCLRSSDFEQYAKKNNLDKQIVMNKLQMMYKDEKKYLKQLGIYNYLLYSIYSDNDKQLDYFHFRKAHLYISQYYKRQNIITVFNKTMLIDYMNQIDSDPELEQQYFQSALSTINNTHHNPFILITLNKLKISCGKQKEQVIILELQKISYQFAFNRSLAQLYNKLINNYQKLPNSQVKIQQLTTLAQNINEVRYNLKKPFSIFDVQRIGKKIKRYSRQQRFQETNHHMKELFLREKYSGLPNKQRQTRIHQIWKSLFDQFMELCNNLAQLLEFEEITRQFFEDGYNSIKKQFQSRKTVLQKKQ